MTNESNAAYSSFLQDKRDKAASYFLPLLGVLNGLALVCIAVSKM